jgi:aldehyde:ferredoxin oxidoreductase
LVWKCQFVPEAGVPKGYNGKILGIDLTTKMLTVEELPEASYRRYIGGSALGMRYILKEMGRGADALGPDNILTLMPSVLTGAPVSGQSRLSANAKSPLVDGIGDSQCGGFFPAELKFAGFDGIVVRGQSNKPVVLWIKDGHAELRDASHLWGRVTHDVEALLKEELGDDSIEVLQCGPAGEKMVRMAAIMNMSNRANGRTGMGAVMGSKGLKAIAVRGSSKRLPTADPKRLNHLARLGVRLLPDNAAVAGLREDGTAGVVPLQQATGGLPTHNYGAGQFDDYEAISGEAMTDTILTDRDSCYACAVRCKRVVKTDYGGERVEKEYGGPEYETISAFGSYCGVGDLDAIALANQYCNMYGLDTISTGATIAWAMECYENNVLTQDEVGFSIHFGDADAMVKLTKMIALREGFGNVLAEGSRKAAERLGKGHDLLMTVKGAEVPAHMPHVKRSLGLIYAVNPFGADHQSSEHDTSVEVGAAELYTDRLRMLGLMTGLPKRSLTREKVEFALRTQYFYSFLDSADLCQFVWGPAWTLYGPQETVELVKAITGWGDFTMDELFQVGERRLNMLRIFNAREGMTRDQDRLPKKLYKALRDGGPTGGVALDAEEIRQAQDWYYEMSGWDLGTGNPLPETLERLGLGWVA